MRVRDLFVVVMLAGIYSLLSASFFVAMDAVDVAFTEASVGAGISTILLLKTLTLTGRYESPARQKPVFALFVVLITGALLVYGTLDMPPFGSASAPVHQHVAPYYIKNTMKEIGVPNIVTAVLAGYRALDTFGETIVIFTAGIGVLGLLSVTHRINIPGDKYIASMHQHMVLRIVAKILIPLILIFALYVQFHGDYGPGGGFQAGVIFAAAIILYSMLFGMNNARQIVSQPLIQFFAALGLLIYGSVGLAGLITGESFLDYHTLLHDEIEGQHLGILLVELGVGITVASTMIIIFFNFPDRIDENQDSEK